MNMRSLSGAIFCALSASTPALADSKSSVEAAFYLCAMIDSTKLASKPCSVSGWSSKVEVTMDMTSSTAREVCPMLAKKAREAGRRFDERWTLHIKSPYSGDNAIAYCNLQ